MMRFGVIFFVFFGCFGFVVNGFADMVLSSDASCVVDTSGQKRFYFCGKNNVALDGSRARCGDQRGYSGSSSVTRYHKEPTSNVPGQIYWCCDPNNSGKGKFIKQNTWETTTKDTTSFGDGGSCEHTITKDACGTPTSDVVKCSCASGYVQDGDSCVKKSDSETQTSNTVNNNQGNNNNNNSSIIPYNTDDYIAVSREDMKKCALCKTNDSFKTCAINKCGNDNASGDYCTDDIKKNCLLKGI